MGRLAQTLGVRKIMSAPFHTTGFTAPEHRAIERFLTFRTIPLSYEQNGRSFVQGTGSFYRTGEDFFIVTAAHVLNGINPGLLGVPDRPFGNVSIWNLEDIRVYHPKNTDDFDVAIIRLLNPNFIERVAKQWQCVNESEVVQDSEDVYKYLIAGYPSETVKDLEGVLTPAPMLQLFTEEYKDRLEAPVPEYDLLLRYKRTGKDIKGNERSTPALQGVSGALVYAQCNTDAGIWSPESIFRPVGVQVSMKHGEYVRVKRWALIRNLIEVVREQGI